VFFRKAALRPVPRHALVDPHVIQALESAFDEEEDTLQDALDRGYAELDRKQPALTLWLAEQLSITHDELIQSLGYFLVVSVYLAFRDAFPTRLVEVDEDALFISQELLRVDEELRATDPHEVLESDDVVALSQPSILAFVQHHVQEALEQADGEVDLEDLDRIYRAVLVQVISLSHAVRSPSGELGPPREALA